MSNQLQHPLLNPPKQIGSEVNSAKAPACPWESEKIKPIPPDSGGCEWYGKRKEGCPSSAPLRSYQKSGGCCCLLWFSATGRRLFQLYSSFEPSLSPASELPKNANLPPKLTPSRVSRHISDQGRERRSAHRCFPTDFSPFPSFSLVFVSKEKR